MDLVIAHSFCTDVLCGHGCPENDCAGGTRPKQFNILRNDGTGVFTNVTVAAGFPANFGEKLIMGPVSGDVDGDGDFDLMMNNGIDRAITLARNNGNGVYQTAGGRPANEPRNAVSRPLSTSRMSFSAF